MPPKRASEISIDHPTIRKKYFLSFLPEQYLNITAEFWTLQIILSHGAVARTNKTTPGCHPFSTSRRELGLRHVRHASKIARTAPALKVKTGIELGEAFDFIGLLERTVWLEGGCSHKVARVPQTKTGQIDRNKFLFHHPDTQFSCTEERASRITLHLGQVLGKRLSTWTDLGNKNVQARVQMDIVRVAVFVKVADVLRWNLRKRREVSKCKHLFRK